MSARSCWFRIPRTTSSIVRRPRADAPSQHPSWSLVMSMRLVLIGILLLAGPYRASADTAPNVVTYWATVVQQAIHNAGAPRSAGTSQMIHTMVTLAVYDAVIAI